MAATTVTYTFSSTDSWIFDGSSITITASLAKIKSRMTSADMFFASFNDSSSFNADYSRDGSTTVRSYTSYVEINEGAFEICEADASSITYVDFQASANHGLGKGCIEVNYIPKYTGAPTKDTVIFFIFDTSDNAAAPFSIRLFHGTGQSLSFSFIDNSAAVKAGPHGVVNLVSGQEYVIQCNYNFEAGNSAKQYLFMNGSAVGTATCQTFIRSGLSANINIMRFGDGASEAGGEPFKLSYIRCFDDIQNTADYTFGTEISSVYTTEAVSMYATSAVKGSIISFTADETNGSNTHVNFVFNKSSDGQSYYYDGNNWVSSNLSIAQANCEAVVNTNISAILNSSTNTNDQITPRVILQSTDGVNTPYINNISMEANLFDSNIPEVVFNFNVADVLGSAFTSATLKIYSNAAFFHSDILVLPFRKSLTSDSAGNIYGSIIETETVSKTLNFELEYIDPNTNQTKKVKWNNKTVINNVFASASDLLGDPD